LGALTCALCTTVLVESSTDTSKRLTVGDGMGVVTCFWNITSKLRSRVTAGMGKGADT